MRIFKCIVLIFLAFIVTGCNKKIPIRHVETEIIKQEDILNTKVFPGTVVSDNSSDLSFKIEGQILKIYAKEGDKVAKNQVLAKLDNIIYKLDENQAKANLDDATILYQNAKNYYKRIDMLHKEGGISDSDWEKAYTNMKSSEYKIENAKERLVLAKKMTSYGDLKAPSDGTISQKIKYEGDYVTRGEPIFKFLSGNLTKVQIIIPQNYIGNFKIGDICTVSFDSIENLQIKGKIYSISPSSIGGSGYQTKIVLSKNNPQVYTGMSANVLFENKVSNIKNPIFIPVTSVQSDNTGIYVYIIQKSKDRYYVKKKYVKIGELFSDKVQIIKGLEIGEKIVIKGIQDIYNNQEVLINKND